MKLTWSASHDDKGKARRYRYLFVGNLPEPVAFIYKSNSGKTWSWHMELPGCMRMRQAYLPLDQAMQGVESAVHTWFDYAMVEDVVLEHIEAYSQEEP